MVDYTSDVKLGETYTDSQTGFEGIATGVFFYQYGCERVSIERLNPTDGRVICESFDSPRLVHKETQKVPNTKRTGGPGNGQEMRKGPERR